MVSSPNAITKASGYTQTSNASRHVSEDVEKLLTHYQSIESSFISPDATNKASGDMGELLLLLWWRREIWKHNKYQEGSSDD